MAVLIQCDAWFLRSERPQPSGNHSLLRRFVRRRWKVLFTLCFVGLLSDVAQTQAPPSESELKAAFIYNFAKFAEWPPGSFSSPSAPIHLCVLGNNALRAELQTIVADKSIASRPLQARSVDRFEIKDCHVLFVGLSDSYRLRQALQAAQGASVLTIGDNARFLDQGGMINFILDQNRIRFEVNLKAAQAAHLQLSSKLLSLAKTVQM